MCIKDKVSVHLHINSSGTINPSASKIGFQWDSVPANTEPYTLVNTSGSGCSSGTVTFTDFFGNWFDICRWVLSAIVISKIPL